ncbi:BMP family ABC transporter substrate-binding protein [Marinibaculum pumilum]|uniref:BMP family ABC transporter substrate-binding protein n=1 Tax=Marinibaculum pumilum TaxID=1766165 RepID=A0ABV7L9S1_9PROT
MFRRHLRSVLAAAGIALLSAAATAPVASRDAHAAMGLDGDPKVAFLYIAPVGDGGWTFMHDQSRKALEAELGSEVAFTENIPEVTERVRQVIDRYVKRGYNVIVGTAYGYSDAFAEAAKEYPEVVFLNAAGYTSAPNLTSYYGRSYEGMYLAGMAAGAVSKTGKLGFVAAYPLGLVNWNINAFALGAQKMNPDAEVIVSFTNTWYDPVKEEAAAQALIEQGVDVIAQHQDTPGPQIAAERAGIHSVGYNADMSSSAPNAHLVASVFDWGKFVLPAVKRAQDGSFEGGFAFEGMDTGVVGISDFTSDAVPEAAKKEIMATAEKIANGDFYVFSGPIAKQDGTIVVPDGEGYPMDKLFGMDFLVKGTVGSLE